MNIRTNNVGSPLTPTLSPLEREKHSARFNRWWVVLATVLALAVVLLFSGCALTVEKTEVVSFAAAGTNAANGQWQMEHGKTATNITTTWKRERTLLPPGYALIVESDVYGVKVNFPTAQNPSPNVIAGIDHTSSTWLPTSTNRLHTLKFGKGGTIQNKAVPFWMSTGGWLVTEDDETIQGVDTNGNAYSSVRTATNAPAVPPAIIQPGVIWNQFTNGTPTNVLYEVVPATANGK